jgi:hypothetical protein
VEAPIAVGQDVLSRPNDAEARTLSYALPAGWREDPTPRTARVATVVLDDGSATELAITRFPGDVGGELANVNRWRAQLGPPSVASTNSEDVSDMMIGGGSVRLYRLSGPDESGEALGMLVAFVQHAGHTWFFKMTGPRASLDAQRALFEQFLESVQFTSSP